MSKRAPFERALQFCGQFRSKILVPFQKEFYCIFIHSKDSSQYVCNAEFRIQFFAGKEEIHINMKYKQYNDYLYGQDNKSMRSTKMAAI